jgi:predicted Zn-dependent protease
MGEAGMQGEDADHEQAQRWLSALRDGTDTEKIAARRSLARMFEQRGMLKEAVDLLEANVRAGELSGEIFRWLARLYREQGEDALSLETLAEAAKYRPSPAPAKAPALRHRPVGSPPPWAHRRLALYLIAVIGLGIVIGVAVWWVASLLRP